MSKNIENIKHQEKLKLQSKSERIPSFKQLTEEKIQQEEPCIDDYELGAILGRGAYGVVNLAIEKDTGITVAIKTVRMSQVLELGKQRHILREKEILKILKHPTIIKLLKTFKDEQNLYFIFENAVNGTLDDFIKFCKNKVGEDLVKILFGQMINFMEYIQINGVMHRDLKPGNIMIDANYNIKMIDFGDAKQINEENKDFQ